MIAAGEGPVHARRRRFVQPRDDGDGLIVILWIGVPADGAHDIFEEIDQCRAVLPDEVGAAVHMVSWVMPNASFCVNKV